TTKRRSTSSDSSRRSTPRRTTSTTSSRRSSEKSRATARSSRRRTRTERRAALSVRGQSPPRKSLHSNDELVATRQASLRARSYSLRALEQRCALVLARADLARGLSLVRGHAQRERDPAADAGTRP